MPLLHALGEGVADDSRATRTWATRASACFVAALFVAAGVIGASSPSARASLGLEKVVTPAERVVGDPVVADVKSLPPDPTEKKPFTAMEGMLRRRVDAKSVRGDAGRQALLQQLPKYGASVDWSRIMAALNSGIGKNGSASCSCSSGTARRRTTSGARSSTTRTTGRTSRATSRLPGTWSTPTSRIWGRATR